MTSVKVAYLGGPVDGRVEHRPSGTGECVDVASEYVFEVNGVKMRKMYHYHRYHERRLYFQREWIADLEEGGEVDMKKFGTGQIIESEDEQDTTKTASTQQWDEGDEQALSDEDQEG